MDSLRPKIKVFETLIYQGGRLDQPQSLIESILRFKTVFDQVKRETKHSYIRNITTNLGMSDVPNWDRRLSELSSGMASLSKSELKTEPYISQLISIQTIQTALGEIRKKKEELSRTKSYVGEITKVETGITQLKQIKETIKDFGFVATVITSLEQAYHFERITLWDFNDNVKGLMTVISKIVRVVLNIH